MSTEKEKLVNKAFAIILAMFCSAAMGLAGFNLKEGYRSSLDIKGLSVQMDNVEESVAHNNTAIVDVKVLDERVKGIEDDISEIKSDLKTLINRK